MRPDMSPGDLFAYLSAFVTIGLALAVGDMVQSVHRLIAARRHVRWHPLPLASAALVFLLVVSEFFSLSRLYNATSISYFGVLGLLSVPILVSLAAFAALPDEAPGEGVDLLAFYDGNRGYLYGVLIVSMGAEVVRSTSLSLNQGIEFFSGATLRVVLLSAACTAVYGALIRWRDLRVQTAGLTILMALYIAGFAGWEIQAGG